MPTIALVDDDRNILTSVSMTLESEGYRVNTYNDGASALDGLSTNPPDLAILDISLNAEVGGGYEVCRYLKQQDASLPIIFLTSRGDELDKIYGLQLGAWDYQTKPVTLKYLMVRIESFFQIKQLAVHANNHGCNKKTGALNINTKSMQCFWKEQEINLTPTEFSIIAAMVETEQAVSVDDLIKATRQGVVEDNTINTHILHIRKKFKQADKAFQCIKTRYGFGYQWLCE